MNSEERISNIRRDIYSLECEDGDGFNLVSRILGAMLDEIVKTRQEYEQIAKDGWEKSRELYKATWGFGGDLPILSRDVPERDRG